MTEGTGDDVWGSGGQNLGRLLSASVQLSDPDDYTGGELQIGVTEVQKSIGMVIIFPSHILHRVRPVTSGEQFCIQNDEFCIEMIIFCIEKRRNLHQKVNDARSSRGCAVTNAGMNAGMNAVQRTIGTARFAT